LKHNWAPPQRVKSFPLSTKIWSWFLKPALGYSQPETRCVLASWEQCPPMPPSRVLILESFHGSDDSSPKMDSILVCKSSWNIGLIVSSIMLKWIALASSHGRLQSSRMRWLEKTSQLLPFRYMGFQLERMGPSPSVRAPRLASSVLRANSSFIFWPQLTNGSYALGCHLMEMFCHS